MINNDIAVNLLSILGSKIRLPIFRMLIQAGNSGLQPKYITDKLDIKPNKLSFHLKGMRESGLVSAKKNGRELIYCANYQTTQDLVAFLFENCCSDDESKECVDVDLCG